MKLLAITVGGEPAPVLCAIREGKPDFVLFFASTFPNGGSSRLLRERTDKGPPLIEQAGLSSSQFEIVELDDHDDLDTCFRQMTEAMETAAKRLSPQSKVANYTGGTKTMCASLVVAASYLGWKLELVTGPRDNLRTVTPGAESLMAVVSPSIKVSNLEAQAKLLFDASDYAALEELLGQALREWNLPGDERNKITALRTLARAFKLWDNFQYESALEVLRTVANFCPKHVSDLAMIVGKDKPGYKRVSDILGSALRRADQGLYDDAVIRLYRAVEILAQLRLLREHELDTGNLDLDRIPEPLKGELRTRSRGRTPVTAGLFDSYRILAALGDPLGHLFANGWDKRLKNLMLLRNKSLLTHGLRPISRDDWEKAKTITMQFMEAAQECLKASLTPIVFLKWEDIEKCK